MDHFKLTPFETRYLKTPYEWMEFSYLKSMNSLSEEEVRERNITNRIAEIKKKVEKERTEKEDEVILDQLSSTYTDEERDNILKALGGE